MKNKVKKTDNRELFKIILLCIGVYFVYALFSQLLQLRQAGGRLEEAKEELNETQRANEELQDQLNQVESDEYREIIVRDELNMQKPGEQVLIVPDEDIGVQFRQNDELEVIVPNWRKWLEVFLH